MFCHYNTYLKQSTLFVKIFARIKFRVNSRRDVEMRENLFRNYAQRAGARKLIRAKIFHCSVFISLSLEKFYFISKETRRTIELCAGQCQGITQFKQLRH